jgi:hypothetical protein
MGAMVVMVVVLLFFFRRKRYLEDQVREQTHVDVRRKS